MSAIEDSQIKTDYSSLYFPFKRDAFMKWTKEHLTDLRCKMTTEKRSQQQNKETKFF